MMSRVMAMAKTASLKKAMRSTWKSCLGWGSSGRPVSCCGRFFFCIIIKGVAVVDIKNPLCVIAYGLAGDCLVSVQLLVHQVGVAQQLVKRQAVGPVHYAHVFKGKGGFCFVFYFLQFFFIYQLVF